MVTLSRRELVVSALVVNGATMQEASQILGIAVNTGKHHLLSARRKFTLSGVEAGTTFLLERALAGPWTVRKARR